MLKKKNINFDSIIRQIREHIHFINKNIPSISVRDIKPVSAYHGNSYSFIVDKEDLHIFIKIGFSSDDFKNYKQVESVLSVLPDNIILFPKILYTGQMIGRDNIIYPFQVQELINAKSLSYREDSHKLVAFHFGLDYQFLTSAIESNI